MAHINADQMVKLGTSIASKAVLTLLETNINTHLLKLKATPEQSIMHKQKIKKLSKIAYKIKKYIPTAATSIFLSFDETPITLNIMLSIVNADYVMETLLPDEKYIRDLEDKTHFLRKTALIYWNHFKTTHKSTINNLTNLMEQDIELHVFKNGTLGFDNLNTKYIGVIILYAT